MELHTYFVIGVNGVGKTTTLETLKTLLPEEKYAIYDFDQRGVPLDAGHDWVKKETKYWLSLAEVNKQEGKQTIIFGNVKPQDIDEISKDFPERPKMILLDVNVDALTERLKNQYHREEDIKELYRITGRNLEKFIAENVYHSELLRELRFMYGFKIIDTTKMTPTEISAQIMQFVFAGGEEE